MTAATPTRQASGAPLGLALLLERGGVTLVAPARALASGVTLLEFAATLSGPRPGSAAECRARVCGVGSVRLRVEVEVLLAWVRGRVGAGLPGWSVEQVEWDMAEGTGDAVWTLRGRDWAGASAWLRVEATVALRGGVVEIGARRCWWLGPAGTTAERQWRALTRRLCGRGVVVRGGRLVVDVLRAGVGVEFAAAGWRLPGMAGVACRLRVAAGSLEWRAGAAAGSSGREDGGWSLGQVRSGEGGESELEAGSTGFDPLAQVRGWLRGDRGERGRAERALAGLAAAVPELAGELSRVRVAALRFVDRAACVAALGEWISWAPTDSEPRWLLVVQQARRGDDDGVQAALAGLAGLPAETAVWTRRVLAQAIALQRRELRGAGARALLEPLVAGLPGCPQELQAAVWRALARARAADAATPGSAVEAAVAAALGEEGWRRREEAGELRGQVAAALVASGRREADTTRLLRRMLGDERPGRGERGGAVREDRSEGAVREDRSEGRGSVRIVADYYAQEGRWTELVTLLGRELVALDGVARVQVLRRLARIYLNYLHDPVNAERALRVALAALGEDEGTRRDRSLLHEELATCLEMQGRHAEAMGQLEGAQALELSEGTGVELAEGTGGVELAEGTGGVELAEGTGGTGEGDELARVLTEVARAGTVAQLDAVLAAAAALHGSPARLRVALQAWATGRPLQPGLTLGLARLHG
ncbi:MAG: hypothetical protein IPO88_02615 [Nannocystis sp.]|uniref:hypothetical protein n=1 Tax=Nannocystis sp. TaxID=1962667 RepID=UPI002426AD46|nr:hypothetical protein [Nannocystis sp.]MBK9752397.1 hypothetical protein [Nannocystis sp.]